MYKKAAEINDLSGLFCVVNMLIDKIPRNAKGEMTLYHQDQTYEVIM